MPPEQCSPERHCEVPVRTLELVPGPSGVVYQPSMNRVGDGEPEGQNSVTLPQGTAAGTNDPAGQ